MRFEPRLDPPRRPIPLWRRLAWMGLYWLASVAVLGAVALLLRAWIGG